MTLRRPVRGLKPWLGWGIASAVAVAVMTAVWPFSGRLLYDGLIPLPPYRWVNPPASRTKDNEHAQPGAGMIALGPQGSQASEISTNDDQALITFPAGVVGPRGGESAVKVSITPLDPASVAPAPKGGNFDGNAYRVDAVYAASASPVVLTGAVTVVLRYAVHATRMLQAQDTAWVALPTTRYDGSQQILANAQRLGVFAPAGDR